MFDRSFDGKTFPDQFADGRKFFQNSRRNPQLESEKFYRPRFSVWMVFICKIRCNYDLLSDKRGSFLAHSTRYTWNSVWSGLYFHQFNSPTREVQYQSTNELTNFSIGTYVYATIGHSVNSTGTGISMEVVHVQLSTGTFISNWHMYPTCTCIQLAHASEWHLYLIGKCI